MVPGAFAESPPLHAPNLTCIGDWGYWLLAPAGSRVRTVTPSICQTTWLGVHSMVYFLKPDWLPVSAWKAPRLYVVV
jgi:hypothetical protein